MLRWRRMTCALVVATSAIVVLCRPYAVHSSGILRKAIIAGDNERVVRILQHYPGHQVPKVSMVGRSTPDFPALCLAAEVGNMKAIELLLAAGADINERDMFGNSALHWAAGWPMNNAIARNRPEVIESLVKHGADVNWVNHDGDTPLHMAVRADLRVNLEKLVSLGADLKKENRLGHNPRSYAEFLRRRECVDVLDSVDNRWPR